MPSEASSENQGERYKAMPCCVVYQDTTESRTLETKRHATSGRLTADWPAPDARSGMGMAPPGEGNERPRAPVRKAAALAGGWGRRRLGRGRGGCLDLGPAR